MDDEVIRKHIDLYVNNFTLDLGKTGKQAVVLLYKHAVKNKIIESIPEDIFVY